MEFPPHVTHTESAGTRRYAAASGNDFEPKQPMHRRLGSSESTSMLPPTSRQGHAVRPVIISDAGTNLARHGAEPTRENVPSSFQRGVGSASMFQRNLSARLPLHQSRVFGAYV